MPEAITKYAINSTLGTEDFMPLDEKISRQYRFVADNNLYASLNPLETGLEGLSNESVYLEIKKIKMLIEGTLKIKCRLYKTRSYSNGETGAEIYINNELITTLEAGSDASEPSLGKQYTHTIGFDVNDTLTIRLYAINGTVENPSGVEISNLELYGSPKQNIFKTIL